MIDGLVATLSDDAMSDAIANLILDHLRAMRADIGTLGDDVRDIKLRLGSLEGHVGAVLGDVLRQNTRGDELAARISRIERRLELA